MTQIWPKVALKQSSKNTLNKHISWPHWLTVMKPCPRMRLLTGNKSATRTYAFRLIDVPPILIRYTLNKVRIIAEIPSEPMTATVKPRPPSVAVQGGGALDSELQQTAAVTQRQWLWLVCANWRGRNTWVLPSRWKPLMMAEVSVTGPCRLFQDWDIGGLLLEACHGNHWRA